MVFTNAKRNVYHLSLLKNIIMLIIAMEKSISVKNFLKEKLEEKQIKNKSYSLRSFATKMKISPGGLAQILSGKKKLSLERAHDIALNLSLASEEKKLFLLAVEFEQSKKSERKAEVFEKIKKLNTKKTAKFFDLGVDQFKLISQWYGLAILECVSHYGSKFNEKELAKHFGISVNEVKLTIERLIRLEIIEKKSDDCWHRIKDRVLITSHVPSDIIRNYYKSVSEKSQNSYTSQTPQEKISAAETFAFNPEQLEEIRKYTDEYLDKLILLSNQNEKKTTTYQAIVNVFRLNEIEKENI